MNLTFYRVTPLSVLFFRDSRPFVAGEQSLARLQFPPRLSPFLGALRTKFLEDKAQKENKPVTEIVKNESGENELKNITIFWFSFQKDGEPVLPLPFDAFVNWKGLNRNRFEQDPSSDSLRLPFPKSGSVEKLKKKAAMYLTLKGFISYLKSMIPSEEEIRRLSDLWEFENRIGLTLNYRTKTTERSRFYRITVARAKPGVGFLVGVKTDNPIQFPDSFTTRLGGEGHIALWQRIENGGIKAKIASNRLHLKKIIALTHVPIKHNGNGDFQLVNWGLDKLDVIGGWDYKERRPKPLLKAIRPGSIMELQRSQGQSSGLQSEYLEVEFPDEKLIIAKDFIISEHEGIFYLSSFEPRLGEPNTLLVIKQ